MGVKYYESKMNLNWKPILKSIQEVPGLPCLGMTQTCCTVLERPPSMMSQHCGHAHRRGT